MTTFISRIPTPTFTAPATRTFTAPVTTPLSLCRRPVRHPQITKMSASPNPARTAAITGASGGIGKQTAIGLVHNLPQLEHLYLCCRNVAKGEAVATPLRSGALAGRPVDVTVVPVELSSAASVAACAHTIASSLPGASLDLLVCNAGIMASPLHFTANEGAGEFEKLEEQFAVNHLSHALLTGKLLPALRNGDGGRVLFISSMAVSFAKGRSAAPLIAEKTADVVTRANYKKWSAYGDSKLAMSLYAKALAGKEGGVVESVSLHPGVVQTELARHAFPKPLSRMMDGGSVPGPLRKALSTVFRLKTAQEGAELCIELGCAARGSLDNGAMYIATGGKKAGDLVIPMLSREEECERVYEDTQRFVSAF